MSNQVPEAPVTAEVEAEVAAAAAPAGPADTPEGMPPPEPVKKSCTPGLTGWMKRNSLSIAFTSYQSGRLYLLGADPKGRL